MRIFRRVAEETLTVRRRWLGGAVRTAALVARCRRLSARLRASWAARSLLVGAVASGCDYAVLAACAYGLGLAPPVCAMAGFSVGATVNFLLNRRFAFRDSGSGFGSSAARYVAALGLLMVVHAMAVTALTERGGLPIVFSKLVSDVTLLAGGQLLILRYVVFPRNKSAPAPAVAETRGAEVS